MMVKIMNNAKSKAEKLMAKNEEAACEEAPEEPKAPTEAELLTEIRDLLKEQKQA